MRFQRVGAKRWLSPLVPVGMSDVIPGHRGEMLLINAQAQNSLYLGKPARVGLYGFTVRLASLLVTLPALLVTTTEKRAPLSAIVVGGVV